MLSVLPTPSNVLCPLCNVNRLSRSVLGLHSDPYWLIGCLHDSANVQQTSRKRPALRLLKVCWTFAESWDWDWRMTMPEHTDDGAAMRSVAWRLHYSLFYQLVLVWVVCWIRELEWQVTVDLRDRRTLLIRRLHPQMSSVRLFWLQLIWLQDRIWKEG